MPGWRLLAAGLVALLSAATAEPDCVFGADFVDLDLPGMPLVLPETAHDGTSALCRQLCEGHPLCDVCVPCPLAVYFLCPLPTPQNSFHLHDV